MPKNVDDTLMRLMVLALFFKVFIFLPLINLDPDSLLITQKIPFFFLELLGNKIAIKIFR